MTFFEIFIYVSFLLLKILAEMVCDPYIDCVTVGIGSTIPDPLNCENFYGCINNGTGYSKPSTLPLTCPADYYFDAITLKCTQETVPGFCDTNLCAEIRGRQCLLTCPTSLSQDPQSISEFSMALVADPSDCSVYYICTAGEPVKVTCQSPTPYFNGSTCVSESYKCCDFCIPYCYEVGTQIVDPHDCMSFYVCLEVGPPNDYYKVTCEVGTYYDESSLQCNTGTCISLCT